MTDKYCASIFLQICTCVCVSDTFILMGVYMYIKLKGFFTMDERFVSLDTERLSIFNGIIFNSFTC